MGYLDKRSRVVDVVLTERGRKLYALGKLDFAYFGLFDDGIDYDPYSTGTLSDSDRESQIEAFPMLEAPFVRDVRGATAPLEPINHLFTAAPGYRVLPAMDSPGDGDELRLMADQRREGDHLRRTGTTLAQITMHISGQAEQGNPGFVVRVYSSGSNGIQPLDLKRDLSGRRAYDPFIAVAIDDEPIQDVQSVDRPDSARVVARVSPRKR